MTKTSLPTAVADEVRRRVDAGEWTPGERLPSEPELAVELGVSRPTLREALRLLATEGWLDRKHGSGTYVSNRVPVPNSLDVNFGVTDLILGAGLVPGTSRREVSVERAGAVIGRALGITAATSVVKLERVRTANGEPVVHSVDIFPPWSLARERIEALSESVYAALDADGSPVVRGDAHITAVASDGPLGKALGLRKGAPLLRVEQVDLDASGRAMVLSIEHHRPEVFDFHLSRRGPGAA
jgi:GntR family transcriptional regulator